MHAEELFANKHDKHCYKAEFSFYFIKITFGFKIKSKYQICALHPNRPTATHYVI